MRLGPSMLAVHLQFFTTAGLVRGASVSSRAAPLLVETPDNETSSEVRDCPQPRLPFVSSARHAHTWLSRLAPIARQWWPTTARETCPPCSPSGVSFPRQCAMIVYDKSPAHDQPCGFMPLSGNRVVHHASAQLQQRRGGYLLPGVGHERPLWSAGGPRTHGPWRGVLCTSIER